MTIDESFKIDIVPGYDCNFRCKYCFEQLSDKNYKSISMSDDVIENTAKYILKCNNYYKNIILLSVFGGEPLLHTDIIDKIMDKLHYYNRLILITNGTLIDQRKNWLLDIRQKLYGNIFINISYDYSLQDINRQKGTYDLVRENIRWLYRNNFDIKTISVIPRGFIPQIFDIFLDFYELSKEIPRLKFSYNIDRVNASGTTFDFEKSEAGLKKLNEYIVKNNLWKLVSYNASCGYRNDRHPLCVWGNVHSVIDIDGSIYPSYNVVFEPEIKRKMMYLGNVNEDFRSLMVRRKELFSMLNFDVGKKCDECGIACRVQPWRTIKNDISEFNGMPNEEHCIIHKLLAKYLTNGPLKC